MRVWGKGFRGDLAPQNDKVYERDPDPVKNGMLYVLNAWSQKRFGPIPTVVLITTHWVYVIAQDEK